MEIELDVATDIDALMLDMRRFAGLLRLIKQAKIAQNYEDLALQLQSDSSARTVDNARKCFSMTFMGTSGGLTDQYVYAEDGSVDDALSGEYEELLKKLTDFANGTA
ncbi:hypothetical protein VUN84_13210 [Micrococcaceae bacterium Sec5.8]